MNIIRLFVALLPRLQCVNFEHDIQGPLSQLLSSPTGIPEVIDLLKVDVDACVRWSIAPRAFLWHRPSITRVHWTQP